MESNMLLIKYTEEKKIWARNKEKNLFKQTFLLEGNMKCDVWQNTWTSMKNIFFSVRRFL